MMNTAIVVVDELYDFIDGSLACGNAEEAVAETVRLIGRNPSVPVLFVCDHHPANHSSFAEQGGPWPPHCVAGTHGGDIHEALHPFVLEELTFFKGCDPAVEQYSGFDGRNPAGQSLAEVLGLLETELVLVTGIATEYCVRNTAEDLLKAGFKVSVVRDCLGYVSESGHLKVLPELEAEGIRLV